MKQESREDAKMKLKLMSDLRLTDYIYKHSVGCNRYKVGSKNYRKECLRVRHANKVWHKRINNVNK